MPLAKEYTLSQHEAQQLQTHTLQVHAQVLPARDRLVFVLDNDECLGAWSIASGIHMMFSGYIPVKTGIPVSVCVKVLKDCLVKHYLPNGGARPGTKDTLKLIKFFKDSDLIDKVLMFTSAENKDDWVIFLKECLEEYAGVTGLYDLVLHKDNTNSQRSHDGSTLKCLDMVREKLNFEAGKTKVVMIDDKPHNVIGDGVRVSVSAYRHVVDECHLSDMIDECLDTLQTMYKPIDGKKTYNPSKLIPLIKESVLVHSDGRKKDIKNNDMIYMCSSNQLDDNNLIENCSKTFIEHLPFTQMTRSLSEHIPHPMAMSRSLSIP